MDTRPSQVGLTVSRVLTLLFLFMFIGMYLWGIQLAYDKASDGWARALLFSLIIFGGGFSWDVLKVIATLPDQRMEIFASAMWKTLGWMFLYATAFLLGSMVLGPLAGFATIGVIFYWLVSAFALYKFFVSFDRVVSTVLSNKDDTA